jgi:hypothetical protein
MQTRNDGAQALQDAVEMAVLSSVQHPNIVQVFACLTDMVKTTGAPRPQPQQPPPNRHQAAALPSHPLAARQHCLELGLFTCPFCRPSEHVQCLVTRTPFCMPKPRRQP